MRGATRGKFRGRRHWQAVALVAIVIAGISAFVGYPLMVKDSSRPVEVSVWLRSTPFSFDPLVFDSEAHHMAARPCLAGLVTQYKAGTFQGVIADTWTNDKNFTEWRFKIRPSLVFENGDLITPQTVERSLTRMAWLQHSRGSHSGVTENLLGIEGLESAEGKIPGIAIQGDEVVLGFKSPQPKLLEAISFGLYSVVHPTDYDSHSGQWKDPKHVVASGPYARVEWGATSIKLSLRPAFPASLRHPRAPNFYVLQWAKERSSQAMLAQGTDSDGDLHADSEFHTSGETDIGIWYIRLFTWKKPGSPLSDPQLRRRMRESFYRALIAQGLQPVKSFLPPSLPGITEFQDDADDSCNHAPKHDSFRLRGVQPTPEMPPFRQKLLKAISVAVAECGGEFTSVPALTTADLLKHGDPDLPNHLIDVAPAGTGLLVEDPDSDIKFMIKSKEGIRLADPTGRLQSLASADKLDIAAINKVIWEDAAVWPVTPFRDGLWAQKGKLDFSMINLNLPPTDLSWIGLNI